MSIINFSAQYVPDPIKGRPLFSGQIYVGEPDLDPEIIANQKQLSIVQEDGTKIAVSQPFIIGHGGVPQYNGSTCRLDVSGNYSIKILSKNGSQRYYIHNVFSDEPLTADSFRIKEPVSDVATLRSRLAEGYYSVGDIVSIAYAGLFTGKVVEDVVGGDYTDNSASVITETGGASLAGDLIWLLNGTGDLTVQSLKILDLTQGLKISTGATKFKIAGPASSRGITLLNGNKAIPLNGLWLSDYGLDDGDEATDYSAKCELASQDLSDSGGGSLIASSKINLGAAGFTIHKGVSIRGLGQSASQFLYSGIGVAITIISTESLGTPSNDAKPHTGHKHRNFSVVQVGAAKTGTGIWNKHNTRATLANITVKSFNRGIDCSGACWINTIKNCWIVLNKYGIYLGATDSEYREPTNPAYTTIALQGLNASAIRENELQANEYGVYSASYVTDAPTIVFAIKLVIDNNSIEGGGQAVHYTPHQPGLTITNNYTEVNGVGMTIDPATVSSGTDMTLVQADFVQNKFAGSVTQVGLSIRDNHQISPTTNALIYIDRCGVIDISDNDGFGTVILAKQRAVDFSVGPYTISSNSGTVSLDSASQNNTISTGNSGLDNFIGASRTFEFKSKPILSKGVELHPPSTLSVGSTTPETDLTNITNNTFYWDFVSGTGYPIDSGSTAGSIYGYKNTANGYQYCWQEYISAYGNRYRRHATSATVWGAFAAV